MLVKEMMSKQVWTAGPDNTLEDAAGLMWDHDIGALPVVDAEHKVIGMITDRDICMAAYTQGKTLRDIHVGEVMSRQVMTVDLEDQISAAEEIMQRAQVRRLPVLDGVNQVVGMLSLNDLARTSRRRVRGGVNAEEVAGTLAAISTPRVSN